MKGKKVTTIITEPWSGNREVVFFKLRTDGALELLPGAYESNGEFTMLNPIDGVYEFIPLYKYLQSKVGGY